MINIQRDRERCGNRNKKYLLIDNHHICSEKRKNFLHHGKKKNIQ